MKNYSEEKSRRIRNLEKRIKYWYSCLDEDERGIAKRTIQEEKSEAEMKIVKLENLIEVKEKTLTLFK